MIRHSWRWATITESIPAAAAADDDDDADAAAVRGCRAWQGPELHAEPQVHREWRLLTQCTMHSSALHVACINPSIPLSVYTALNFASSGLLLLLGSRCGRNWHKV